MHALDPYLWRVAWFRNQSASKSKASLDRKSRLNASLLVPLTGGVGEMSESVLRLQPYILLTRYWSAVWEIRVRCHERISKDHNRRQMRHQTTTAYLL